MPVLQTYENEIDVTYTITIDGESIETTAGHPFYTTDEGWTGADKLEAGDEVELSDGSSGTVESVERNELDEPVTIYNFTVMDYHTYYVGENEVLVHNVGGCRTGANFESGTDALRTGNSKVINSMSKEQLQANLPDGWTYTEHNGRVHIKDASGNFRVRIDPPNKVTNYQHMHILDELGNPLDIDGNIVSPKSPDGHIPWDN